MALIALFANSLFASISYRALLLILVGLLATTALAACGPDPEPTSAPPPAAAATASNAQPVAAIEQPAQEASPAAVPGGSAPPMEAAREAAGEPANTPAPPLAPIAMGPSTTRKPREAPTVSLGVDATAAGESGAGETGTGDSPSQAAGGLALGDFGPDTTWGDVFETFSEAEQACVRKEFGSVSVDPLLELPFSLDALPPLSANKLVGCVSDEVAGQIALAEMSRQMGGLSEEEAACLQELLEEIPVSKLIEAETGEPTPESAMLKLSYGLGVLNCLPHFAEQAFNEARQGGEGESGEFIEDPSFLWSFSTGGWVIPAPAVADGVVYVGSDDHSLYALDAETGSPLWSRQTGAVIHSTPTVADGKVYVGSNDNHVYALDAATGAQLWKYDTGEWVQYSPAVSGGRVYFGARSEGDRKVHAVDAATGEVAWVAEHPFPIGGNYTPAPIGERVYAQGAEYGQFFALDAATGEVAWQADVSGYVESAPTVVGGVVYLTVINQAYALNEATGEVIWHVNTEEFPARDFPALVVDGVYYLAPSDKVYALDAATGDELWSYESFMLSTAPVVAGGVLYGASGDAEFIFALDARSGEELWAEPTEDFSAHSLMVVDGILYGELDSGYLFTTDANDGRQIWGMEKGGFSDVQGYTVKDGVMYFGGTGNEVRAHRAP